MDLQDQWPGEVIEDDEVVQDAPAQLPTHEVAPDTAPQPEADPYDAALEGIVNEIDAPEQDPGIDRSNVIAVADPGKGDVALSTEVKTVKSPWLTRHGAQLGRMLASNAPDAEIMDFAKEAGAPANELNIQEALNFRHSPQFREWKRQNPNAPYPINDSMEVPLDANQSALGGLSNEKEMAQLAATPGASMAAGALDTMTLGFADELAGLAGADTEDFRLKQELSAAANPTASVVGQLAGGTVLPTRALAVGKGAAQAAFREALAGGVARAEARQIAKDAARKAIIAASAKEGAAYGGAYGAGSAEGDLGDRAIGAAAGAAGGAILGGAIPAAGEGIQAGASGVKKAVVGALDAVTPAGARNRAGKVLEANSLRPIGDILRDISSRAEPVPGANPTLAEVAGDTGLAGLQRGVANTSGVENAAIAERNAANSMARTRYASEAMGDGTPQAVQDFSQKALQEAEGLTAAQQAQRTADLEAQYQRARDIASRRTQQAQGTLGRATEAVGDVSDREASGSVAREAFDTAYEEAKARSREAYGAPELQNPVPIDLPAALATEVRAAADAFYGDGGGTMPEALRQIIGDMFEQGATTRTLTNIDRRLADFSGEARMAGRNSESAFAERIRGDLSRTANRVAPKEYRDALSAAKAIRAEQGRVFESGGAATAFARDRYGNPAVGNTEVPGRIVRPGAPGGTSVDGLVTAIGPQNAERIVREELRRAVDDAAIQTEAQARRLSVRYAEAARRFPSVEQDLRELQAHARALDAANHAEAIAGRAGPSSAEKAAAQELSALHSEILATPMAKIADSARDPSAFITGLLGRSDKGRALSSLWNRLGDNEEAQQGFRRALGDFIESAGEGPNVNAAGDNIPSINKTRRAISTVIEKAGDSLTREQKIALGRVSRELDGANFAATAGKPAGSDTALNASYGGLLGKIPFAGKAVSTLQIVVKALSNQKEVDRLLREAILDPDFAATLLKRASGMHLDRVRTKLISSRPAVMFSPSVGERIGSVVQNSTPTRLAADEAGNGSLGVPQDEPQNSQDYPGEELP